MYNYTPEDETSILCDRHNLFQSNLTLPDEYIVEALDQYKRLFNYNTSWTTYRHLALGSLLQDILGYEKICQEELSEKVKKNMTEKISTIDKLLIKFTMPEEELFSSLHL